MDANTMTGFAKAMMIGRHVSKSLAAKMEAFPDGATFQIKSLLDGLEAVLDTQSLESSLSIDGLRDKMHYAEGYEGFIKFPEKTVREAVKAAVCELRTPVEDQIKKMQSTIQESLKSALEEARPALAKQMDNPRSAEDFEQELTFKANEILSRWATQAMHMVRGLMEMEYEFLDVKGIAKLIDEYTTENQRAEIANPRSADAVPSDKEDSKHYIMGHLDKKNRLPGLWSTRWMVVHPKTCQLFVHRDAEGATQCTVDLAKMQLIENFSFSSAKANNDIDKAAIELGSSLAFAIRPLDPTISVVPHKFRRELVLKAPSAKVKQMWLSAIEPLCGHKGKSIEVEDEHELSDVNEDQENVEHTEAEKGFAVIEGGGAIAETLCEENNALEGRLLDVQEMDMETNLESLSLALLSYAETIKQRLALSIPKAIAHLFVEPVSSEFGEELVASLCGVNMKDLMTF